MAIKVLSEQLASQIAAGEVVERPASAVKELVENALDAGATTINVDIRNGGRTLLQVADNGSGISADEVETAFLRHATSKLESAETLAAIKTLGFRGEALAAIASVTRLTIVTRLIGATSGIRLVLEGGHIVQREVVGAPQGTVISVENLFYNTPARLKFLKSVTSEKRAIDEIITRVALAYPSVRFRLTHNERETFKSPGSGNLRDALLAVYGVEIGQQFLPIKPITTSVDTPTSETPITVKGFVSPPSLHRSNRSHISLFVNGRWIRDQRLTYALIEAYHTFLPAGRFPMAALFIEMPFDAVDVNVHPMKTEVRFQNPGKLFKVVQTAVRETLLDAAPARSANSPFDQIVGNRWDGTHIEPRRDRTEEEPLDWGSWNAPEPQPSPQLSLDPRSAQNVGGERLPIMRVIGQVRNSYIITEGPDGMFLIDQHAAHERIMFEQFMAQWEKRAVSSQQLMTGMPVQVRPDQVSLIEDNSLLLAKIGFVVEPFGPQTFVVRSVPALLATIDPSEALRAMVDDLEDEDAPMQTEIEEAMIKKACKTAAIKAGQTLSMAEMEALILQLENCENPQTCPHGRPTLIHMSMGILARQFGRS
jgi:DNA mismatch repair protein MutL